MEREIRSLPCKLTEAERGRHAIAASEKRTEAAVLKARASSLTKEAVEIEALVAKGTEDRDVEVIEMPDTATRKVRVERLDQPALWPDGNGTVEIRDMTAAERDAARRGKLFEEPDSALTPEALLDGLRRELRTHLGGLYEKALAELLGAKSAQAKKMLSEVLGAAVERGEVVRRQDPGDKPVFELRAPPAPEARAPEPAKPPAAEKRIPIQVGAFLDEIEAHVRDVGGQTTDQLAEYIAPLAGMAQLPPSAQDLLLSAIALGVKRKRLVDSLGLVSVPAAARKGRA